MSFMLFRSQFTYFFMIFLWIGYISHILLRKTVSRSIGPLKNKYFIFHISLEWSLHRPNRYIFAAWTRQRYVIQRNKCMPTLITPKFIEMHLQYVDVVYVTTDNKFVNLSNQFFYFHSALSHKWEWHRK